MQLSKSYQLIRKLAAGGMAEVFLARTDGPRGFSKTLVIKRILPHLAGDEQFVEMFLSEARLVAQINHPNVVQIFDFGEFEGAYYIAMEYIDGPNLRTLLRKAHSVGLELEPALCARIVASACEGLAYAHELVDPQTQQPLGLVHRDVSPDNILIARNGTVKVVDFGIAKAIGQQHRTKAGTIKGKLPYMPPEQMRGRPLDRRADVFALGVVLYELLTFKRPFGSGTEAQLMEAVIQKPMRPLKDYRPDGPEALERIIARCLAKDREQRYPSCRHLRADLERFILSAREPVGAEELAGLVARLLPPTQQTPEPVEAVSSSSKSPAPLAMPRATPAPRPRPRAPAAPAPSAKEPLSELEARVLPPPDRPPGPILKTERSVVSLASPEDAPASGPKAPPIHLTDRSAQESLLDAAWEAGLAPTARLASQRGARGRAVGIAALLIGLVIAVGGVIVLGRVPSLLQLEELPFIASVPPVIQPEPPQPPVLTPQPEAPVEHSPPVVEQEPVAEAPKLESSPPSTPEPAPVKEEESEALAQESAEAEAGGGTARVLESPVERVKPAAIAKRGGRAKGLRRSPEQRSRKAAAEQEQTRPPMEEEAAQPAPPEFRTPPAEEPRLAAAVFESSPPAQIRVNGQFAGLSPVTLRNLTPGPVHVEVYDSVKGFAKRRTFVLEPGDNGVLRVEVQQATLELRIHPKAVVFLDGKRLGQTPLEPIRLYEGKHGLRLESEELGKHIITTLTIGPGENHVFEFDMEKDG